MNGRDCGMLEFKYLQLPEWLDFLDSIVRLGHLCQDHLGAFPHDIAKISEDHSTHDGR